MKNILKFTIIIFILFLHSCSSKNEKINIIEEKDVEFQMIESYKEGIKALDDGDVIFAAKKFNEAEILFPQSEWAPKSSLMAAYAFYSQDYYDDAKFQLEDFISKYPNDKRISYAHFLLAISHYETIVDEKKDLEPLLEAKKRFEFIIKEYPGSDFALDSEFKIGLIRDILASKEMYIGKHYIKKEKWIAAINRFKIVINDYDSTIFVEEALHRLVEIHYKIGLIDESKRYANLLGYNYQSSEWYQKSYQVFNKDYKTEKQKKIKKGNFITRKFKSLFD